MNKVEIIGTGSYVPSKVVDNDELSHMVSTDDECKQDGNKRKENIKRREYFGYGHKGRSRCYKKCKNRCK